MSIYNNFTEADFGYWVFEMDDKLTSFISSLYGDIKNHLDFSVNSLELAENWLMKTYKTPEAIDAPHRAITVDGFCRYIGEVFRKKLGGYWDMSFDNPEARQNGPCIVGFDSMGNIVSPYNLMKKALDVKSGSYMKDRVLELD